MTEIREGKMDAALNAESRKGGFANLMRLGYPNASSAIHQARFLIRKD